MTAVTAGEIADFVGAEFFGDSTQLIRGVKTLADATPADLSFLGNPKYAHQLETTKAALILIASTPEAAPQL